MPPFTKNFPPELWFLILPWLRNPTPTSLSRPPRSELRQPHLVQCMRVSKFFKSICEPLLYIHIITDSLPHLFENYHTKTEGRFALTQSLRIEYSEMTVDFTYRQIFNIGQVDGPAYPTWSLIGVEEERARLNLRNVCQLEVRQLSDCLEGFSAQGVEMAKLLPNVCTVAVDSVYARSELLWPWYQERALKPEALTVLDDCQHLFRKFLYSGRWSHFCTRNATAPLSLHNISLASDDKPPNGHTVHFARSFTRLSVTFGSPARWVYDGPAEADLGGFDGVSGSVKAAVNNRRLLARGFEGGRCGIPTDTDIADISIYCSTDRYGPHQSQYASAERSLISLEGAEGVDESYLFETVPQAPAAQEAMTTILGHRLQEAFRAGSGLKDIVRWYPTESAAPCLACGAEPSHRQELSDLVLWGGPRTSLR